MFFIGDVHGNLKKYVELAKQFDVSLQVGDMGIFREKDRLGLNDLDPEKHKFFRGNHDNPEECRADPHYLADYGYIEPIKMFWVAGGYSIDHRHRVQGRDWWPDEELSSGELYSILDQYRLLRPNIVVSHEAPTLFKRVVLNARHRSADILSRTEIALQAMLDVHRPDMWICGHHHIRLTYQANRTRFECLCDMDSCNRIDECFLEMPGLVW